MKNRRERTEDDERQESTGKVWAGKVKRIDHWQVSLAAKTSKETEINPRIRLNRQHFSDRNSMNDAPALRLCSSFHLIPRMF